MEISVVGSSSGWDETTSRLAEAIDKRGLTVLARIDHAAGARAAGMELDEETVFLFGSPRSGTPLMQADRRVGIELPLRILAWREEGKVMLGHHDPRELASSYAVGELDSTLEQMASLLGRLTAEAAG